MPIEFNCTQCGQRLRTPDDTAGKQARCPGCGTLVPIPSRTEPIGSETINDDVLPAERQSAPNPFTDPPPVNPYETPAGEVSQTSLSPAEARGRLMGPAIGMMVCGVLSALPIIQITVNSILTFKIAVDQVQAELPDDPAAQAMAPFMVAAFLLVLLGGMIVVTTLVIAGAVAMLRVKSHFLAKTGAILSLVPCYCCFPIGLPFGIWGLMVLSDVNVRAAFLSARNSSQARGNPNI